jgi:flavin reductase (DIM6/NTAB) family NADH-FMN oxidoreductase RutF
MFVEVEAIRLRSDGDGLVYFSRAVPRLERR